MLKQELTLKQQQKLSPAQIQVIKMIELPITELEQRITQEIQDNITLEEGHEQTEDETFNDDNLYDDNYDKSENENDDFNIDEYITDDDIPDYAVRTHNTSPDDQQEDIPFSAGTTFYEHLLSELNLLPLNDKQKQIGTFIIGNIDDNGYLQRTIESLVDDMQFHINLQTTEEEVEEVLRQIQTLEPVGVGARNLRECLLLQLKAKTPTPAINNAIYLLNNFFDDITQRHYDHIRQRTQLSTDDIQDAIKEIAHTNPKPGAAWGANIYENNKNIIIPDFIIENDNGTIVVSLNNSQIPELRINKDYNDKLIAYQQNQNKATDKEKEAIRYIKQKIDSARWFIDAIQQRNQTLLNTMKAIVRFQHDFFIEGDESYLKPMILKDIADITGYDISTISRVSNSKYAYTEFGTFPLKFFFSESMTNEAGDEVSTRQIKKVLSELINAEDKRHPINDDQIAILMKAQGFQIARRTIAKYREQLGIPVARLRKTI